MPRCPSPKTEAAWLTVADLARVFDVSPQRIRALLAEVPAEFIRANKRGVATLIFGRGFIHWWTEREITRRTGPEDGDPMLSGGNSPALERYRLARAKLAERQLAVERGDLIRRESVDALLGPFFGLLREAGSQLGREFGNSALDLFNEAIDEAERGAVRAVEALDRNGSGDAAKRP